MDELGAPELPREADLDEQVESDLEVAAAETDRDSKEIKDEKKASLLTLFRYRTKWDTFLVLEGTMMALVAACVTPFGFILIGRVMSTFLDAANSSNGTSTNGTNPFATMFAQMLPISIQFYMIAAGSFVTGSLAQISFAYVGERQIQQIRIHFFRSVMRQDITWFETHKSGELNTRFSEDTQAIYESLGTRLSTFILNVATWIACVVTSVFLGWKLALVCLCFSPIIVFVAAVAVRFLRNMVRREMAKYAKAGNVASEVFTAIRTVHAFEGQEKECKRYNLNLEEVRKMSGKKGIILGLNFGTFWFIFFANFAVSLWYITQLIQTEGLDAGDLYPIIILVMRGSATLGVALPYVENVSKSLASGGKVFAVIDAIPQIDSSSDQGLKPNNVTGNVAFKDVSFNYPSRPNVKILKNVSLTVPQGKFLALVGPSGSGKSTVVQMLQRFYDPPVGQTLLDGINIKDLNIKWLRQQIGVVSQEPVLFDTTIAENIRYGNLDVNQELIEKAAREANAHNFISHLPKGYDTLVGDRGAQLSGGQKQRIAIARALVRNPKILLLDEATSALDHESEAIVQSALEQAGKGRTTLVIAHRLSTVRNADLIVAIKFGELVEQGTHDELLEKDGLYAQLVKLQMLEDAEENGETQQDAVKDTDMDMDIQAKVDNGVHSDLNEEPIWTIDKVYKFKDPELQLQTKVPKKRKSDKAKEKEPEVSFKRLLRLNTPEWLYILIGSVSAIIFGGTMPALSFIISEFLRGFGMNNDPEEQNRISTMNSFILGGIGLSFAFTKLIQAYCLCKSGAALTARIRSIAFKAIVNQDMTFFDEDGNQVGFLVTRLAFDAQLVQSATTGFGAILEGFSTGIGVLIVCFFFNWKIGLVSLLFVPLVAMAAIGRNKKLVGAMNPEKTKICGKICSEATDNIRTVASLCREDVFLEQYERVINEMCSDGMRTAILEGLAEGFQLAIPFLAYGSIMLFGSYLVQNGEMSYYEVFRVVISVLLGSQHLGRTLVAVDNYRKGKEAAGRLFHIVDRPSAIKTEGTQGKHLENYNGALSTINAWFRYMSRPNVKVLKGVSLEVHPGETVALVGTSGSGKSTIIQLMERFYDLERGSVLADRTPIPSLDLKWWRSQLALVSQEPILFDCSIAENIAYGDNSRVVPMDEIIAAGRMANIHAFVGALPQGYETNVGSKGTQLSGGQKQRIAIARALVRNPKVLLLDEATSSLDSESERIIQETLDKARQGRTCLVIAHRLSTIQNADKIAVLQHGEIIEIGSHPELMERRGAYFNQVMAQNRKKTSAEM